MRARWVAPFVGLAVAFTACGYGEGGLEAAPDRAAPAPPAAPIAPIAPAASAPRELLVLGSPFGTTVLDERTGSELFSGVGVPGLGDPSVLATATVAGDTTVLRVTRASDGKAVARARVHGDLAIRAVSTDGSLVALMAPLPAGTSPWTPQDRAFTIIVVANPAGYDGTRRFHLKGNFEPEAFSMDHRSLFLIKYVPAIDPVAYRVTRLDLEEGEVYPVFGRLKRPVETMSGTRLMQLPAPDGARLYTLYSSQPSEYATEYDPMQAEAGEPVAFVHTLDLETGWAMCVGLPRAVWKGNADHEALALSPERRSLYVVDTERGVVAVMDTKRLKVLRTASVAFQGMSGGQARAAVSADGRTLLVAAGSRLAVVDTRTMRLRDMWRVSGRVSAVGFGRDGKHVYLLVPGLLEELDPLTGEQVRTLHVPGTARFDSVGSLVA